MMYALQTLILTLFFATTSINHAEAFQNPACTGDVKVYLDIYDGQGWCGKEVRERAMGIPVVEFVNLKTKKSYLLEYVSDNKNDYNNYHFLDSLLCGKYKLYVHYIYSPKVEYNVEVIGVNKNEFRLFQNNTSADTAFTIRGSCHYFFKPDYDHFGMKLNYGIDTLKVKAILERYHAKHVRSVGGIKIYELENVVRNNFNCPLLKELRECGVSAGPIYKYFETQKDINLFSNKIAINIKDENKAAFEKFISEHNFKAKIYDHYSHGYSYSIELPMSYGYGVNSVLNEIIRQPWGSWTNLWFIDNGPKLD